MVTIKHKFQSAKTDGSDPSQIRPSNWNDDHSINFAAGSKLMGRYSSTSGVAQEVGISTGLEFNGSSIRVKISEVITEANIEAALGYGYLPKTGGELTGPVTITYNGEAFNIKSGSLTETVYLSLYRGALRAGYLRSSNTVGLTLQNGDNGGQITITKAGGPNGFIYNDAANGDRRVHTDFNYKPATITSATANTISDTTHTHSVDEESIVSEGMANLALGAVGTYALLGDESLVSRSPGATRPGSTLAYANTFTGDSGDFGIGAISPAGTWMLLGQTGVFNVTGTRPGSPFMCVSLWKRIA